MSTLLFLLSVTVQCMSGLIDPESTQSADPGLSTLSTPQTPKQVQKSLNAAHWTQVQPSGKVTEIASGLIQQDDAIDPATLTTHVQKLEEMVSSLQTQAQTQEHKYTAVLSNVLSKLTDTTNVLSSLRKDYESLTQNVDLMKTDIRTGQIKVQNLSAIQHNLTFDLSDLQAGINLISGDLTDVRVSSEANCKSFAKLSGTLSRMAVGSAFKVIQETSDYCVDRGDVIKFTSVSYNNGSGFDSNTGIYTAPINGTYIFWVNADSVDGSPGSISIRTSRDKLFRHGTWQKPIIFTTTGFLQFGERLWLISASNVTFKAYSSYGGALLHPIY